MIINTSSFYRGFQLRAFLDALDSSGAGNIKIYSGAMPSNNGDPAGTLLVTITLNSPAGIVDQDGELNIFSVAPAMVAATGTAAWARFSNGSNSIVFDCDVGLPASDALVRIDSVDLVAGRLFVFNGAVIR